LIAGRGSEEARLHAAIAGYGFESNVTLAGALPDAETQALLASADLFLTPSLYEGSSLASRPARAGCRTRYGQARLAGWPRRATSAAWPPP